MGSTAAHSARMEEAPASTVQRMLEERVMVESKRIREQAWQEAKRSKRLILGIDDFATRKGSTYNTGIHDLRGGTMLDVIPGRKLEDLRAFASKDPDFLKFAPYGVVTDLSMTYRAWLRESFPDAIAIADRFHVHGASSKACRKSAKRLGECCRRGPKRFSNRNIAC